MSVMRRCQVMFFLRRSFTVTVTLVAVTALQAGSESDLSNSLQTFTAFYRAVEENFAGKINPDETLYQGAIPGMLHTLDPHSSFLDPKYFQLLREEQRGHYFGVGMLVGMKKGRVYVVYQFTNSPAHKAGLRPGDVIESINGKPAQGMNTMQVADLLKGPRGTQVTVAVTRAGQPAPLVFHLTRDAIERKSVHEAQWLRPGIAYLRIENFNEKTGRELEETLRRLEEPRIESLVLDLRGNPGGLLNAGVAVANHFLQEGQTIVSHRGRASAEQTYVARGVRPRRDYAMVVLTDRYSASASEIVAGALQDHDRAWILGDTTFGKGLVQSQYPLSSNTALLLTTAKYYTPSGRLIQRDYSKNSFFEYYYRRASNPGDTKGVKHTDGGRAVYGGDGIAPDEKYSHPKPNRFQAGVDREAAFEFAATYLSSHAVEAHDSWEPGPEILAEFRPFLQQRGVDFTAAEFDENLAWVKQRLRYEMDISLLGKDEADRRLVPADPTVEAALNALPKAKALLENSRQMMARKNGRVTGAN